MALGGLAALATTAQADAYDVGADAEVVRACVTVDADGEPPAHVDLTRTCWDPPRIA
ncbi:MAG TPA: hypothetical protein VHH36_09360 [Candidatus Thermoplasmatota archaeon]|nr:hypothetical protein [Candidatus Thermoplasmatota archaeon]